MFGFSTLEERAQRLFSTKGKALEELDPALFAKQKPGKSGADTKVREGEKNKTIASVEAQIYRYVGSQSHFALNYENSLF